MRLTGLPGIEPKESVNSVNFPEFEASKTTSSQGLSYPSDGTEDEDDEDENERKQQLMWLAQYERECLQRALDKQRVEVPEAIMNAVDLFVRVTDLYGQIYIARDIASRIK
ncbi:hypothetical protein BDR22DRAFT_823590 [Usnea florida]